ncbi:hypothetical protein GE061_006695 [Apolygus lucorum]|uniref:CCHC-type domain-containing protein n=1 Tax=Apolygus lucorum TaxID=248454 RepID=A0A6A4J127_APOLU|nr:hypothetical protein GE061_006695 [Apolygus lucorum]
MSEPGQHSGGAGEVEMSGVLGQLERLMRAYNDLAGKGRNHAAQVVPDTDVPRSMFLEIENWDPDEPGALPVTAFFQIFDDVAGTLTQVKKMRLLRAKTKGTAKQFLIDNAQSHAGLNPYDEARQAMLAWFETENPERAAASLCAARLSQGEGLRQFAERVHRLARSAVKEEGQDLTNVQRQNWIRRKTLKVFIKGLPKELGSLLTNNPPETLEAALRRAEELRETLELDSEDDNKWGISAVTTREERKCYECGMPGHFAARCPRSIGKVPMAGARPQNKPTPRYPCMFCASMEHFPVDCVNNPQKTIYCDYCGVREHLETDCHKKKLLTPVSHPRGTNVPAIEEAVRTDRGEPRTYPVGHVPVVRYCTEKPIRMRVTLSGEPRDLIVDTGAAVSVLAAPVRGVPLKPTSAMAWGADGGQLNFCGEQELDVELDGVIVRHNFLVFSQRGTGLDLFGMDLMKRVPLLIRPDRREATLVSRGEAGSHGVLARVARVELPIAEPKMVIPVTGPVGIMPVTGPGVVVPMTGPGAIAPKTKPEAVVHLAEPETDTPVNDPEVRGPMAEPEMVAPVTGPGATVPMAGFEASVPVVGSGVDVPVAEPVGSIPVAGPETIVPLTEPKVVIPVTESKAIIPISGPVRIVPMIGTEEVIPVAELLGTVPMTDPCMEGAVGDVGCPVALCPAGNPELRRVRAVLDSDPKIECWDGERVDHQTEAETNLWQRGAEPRREVEEVFRDFGGVVNRPDLEECRWDVEHHIDPGPVDPVYLRQHPVPHAFRGEVEDQLRRLLERGVMRSFKNGPWSGPRLVKKVISPVNYEIHDMLRTRSPVVPVNRLKPAMTNNVPDDAVVGESELKTTPKIRVPEVPQEIDQDGELGDAWNEEAPPQIKGELAETDEGTLSQPSRTEPNEEDRGESAGGGTYQFRPHPQRNYEKFHERGVLAGVRAGYEVLPCGSGD